MFSIGKLSLTKKWRIVMFIVEINYVFLENLIFVSAIFCLIFTPPLVFHIYSMGSEIGKEGYSNLAGKKNYYINRQIKHRQKDV